MRHSAETAQDATVGTTTAETATRQQPAPRSSTAPRPLQLHPRHRNNDHMTTALLVRTNPQSMPKFAAGSSIRHAAAVIGSGTRVSIKYVQSAKLRMSWRFCAGAVIRNASSTARLATDRERQDGSWTRLSSATTAHQHPLPTLLLVIRRPSR